MKDYSKCKIQLCFEWVWSDSDHEYDDPKYVYWRIRPSEMTWWDRHFHRNPWRKFKRAMGDNLYDYYTPWSFKDELSHIETVEQAIVYQEKQYKIVDTEYQEKVNNGEVWPRKLNN